MRRGIGRQALFFLAVAAVSAVLVPLTPGEFRWVAWLCFGLSLFWAIAFAGQEVSIPRRAGGRRHGREGSRSDGQGMGGYPMTPPPRRGEGR